jgi:hypothetical protein
MMVCSADKPSLETTKVAVVGKNLTVRVSRISSTGKFHIHFSDEMNLDSFIGTQARRLSAKSGGSTESTDADSSSSQSSAEKTDYLLTDKHLRIKMLPGPEYNSTLLKFKWEVLNI